MLLYLRVETFRQAFIRNILFSYGRENKRVSNAGKACRTGMNALVERRRATPGV